MSADADAVERPSTGHERERGTARESITTGRDHHAREEHEDVPADDAPDEIDPIRHRDGVFGRLLKRLLPSLDAPSERFVQAGESRGPSFTDMLPWAEYIPETKQFAFADGKSYMAVYEIDPIASEGRSQDLMKLVVKRLTPLLSVIPEHDIDPWVVGIYGQFEPEIDAAIERMREYVHPRARGSRYTEDYLARMKEHYRDVTASRGYFKDEVVTGGVWRGQQQRTRIVIYRTYARSTPSGDASLELQQVCSKFENNLLGMNMECRRVDGRGFYNWMRGWFNPKPRLCGGDPRRLDEVAPYPGDEELPYGADLAESMVLTPPEIDQKTGLWYLDGMPHCVLQLEALRQIPTAGVITGEVEREGKRNTLIDRLPSGAVIALNVVIRPQDRIKSEIENVVTASYGISNEAAATREEGEEVLRHQERVREPIYQGELAVYLRAANVTRLRSIVTSAELAFQAEGLMMFDPFMERDPVRAGNFTRGLPGVMRASIDGKYSRRVRLFHANHLLRIAPLFGRGRGTGRPVIAWFNRSGEPTLIDPLSREEKRLNGHVFFAGISGSGKSAQLNAIMDSMIAMYNPRIFIVDLGNSFGPLAEHARAMGRTVHTVRATMSHDVSIPPFAEAIKLVEKGIPAEREVNDAESRREVLETFATRTEDVPEESQERDIMGELEIIAMLMIQLASGGKEVESPTIKIAIRKAIRIAAERAVRGELVSRIPRPEDIADALTELSRDVDYELRREEIVEMANAMRLFCENLNGHLFNRDGDPWPEVDLTVVDMALAGQSGRQETLIMAYVSLVMQVNAIAERDQYKGRPIIFLTDEAHLVTMEELLMFLLMKVTKMWRKLGASAWLATQEIEDIPRDVKRMIGMMETWIAMAMGKDQIELVKDFRPLTAEQSQMMEQCETVPGMYAEGVVLRHGGAMQFRSVPPSLTLALGMTDPAEKAERARIMAEEGVDEYGAIKLVAERIRAKRSSYGRRKTSAKTESAG